MFFPPQAYLRVLLQEGDKKGDSQWQKRSICYCPLGKTNLPFIYLFWWGPQCCLLHQWSHITKWMTRKYTSGHKVTLQSFCTCEITGPQKFMVRQKLEGFIGYLIQILCHELFIRNKVIWFFRLPLCVIFNLQNGGMAMIIEIAA